jgi:hypothetical protein
MCQERGIANQEIIKNNDITCCQWLHNLLNDSTLTEKKSFIKSFVSEVRVTGTEVSLAYNLPVSEGKLASETFGVPPIVHYGGR